MRFTVDDGSVTYEVTASNWGDAEALVYDWASVNLCCTPCTFTVTLEGPSGPRPLDNFKKQVKHYDWDPNSIQEALYNIDTYYGVPR